MKEINLRDYYPFYTTDTIVEVPDEVADLLHEYIEFNYQDEYKKAVALAEQIVEQAAERKVG